MIGVFVHVIMYWMLNKVIQAIKRWCADLLGSRWFIKVFTAESISANCAQRTPIAIAGQCLGRDWNDFKDLLEKQACSAREKSEVSF